MGKRAIKKSMSKGLKKVVRKGLEEAVTRGAASAISGIESLTDKAEKKGIVSKDSVEKINHVLKEGVTHTAKTIAEKASNKIDGQLNRLVGDETSITKGIGKKRNRHHNTVSRKKSKKPRKSLAALIEEA